LPCALLQNRGGRLRRRRRRVVLRREGQR
jgi:hypothetical protein